MRRARRTFSLTRLRENVSSRGQVGMSTQCYQCPDTQATIAYQSEKQRLATHANLSDERSTGPDVSSKAARSNRYRFCLERLRETASWLESWREHWVVTIYWKKAFFSQ